MRFLKTFFRFFTIVTLCSTFTGTAFCGAVNTKSEKQDGIICSSLSILTCNNYAGCAVYYNSGTPKCDDAICNVVAGCKDRAGCAYYSAACRVVEAGNYSHEGTNDYEPCPAGYYCPDGTGYKYSNPCPAGKKRESTGGKKASDCTSCDAGTYSAAGATSCSNCATGQTSSAGSSSCTACTNGPTGSTYFGYAANADGSCPWRSSKCKKNQRFNTTKKTCEDCGTSTHNYLWDSTSATSICWDGVTDTSTVYLCNTSNTKVSYPSGFSSYDIFNCKDNEYTIKVYVKYQNTISYVRSEFTYNGTNGGQVTTESNHYIADPINTYISNDLAGKYTINGTTYKIYKNVADMNNDNSIGSQFTLSGNTLYLSNSNNITDLPDGTTLYTLIPLTGKTYDVYMISNGYNNGAPSPIFNADTTAVATKKFGDTPSTGVTPDKNKVSTCSFVDGTTTYYGYIADDTAPKYYECKKNSTNFNLISNSSNGSTNMFEPSQGGNDICIGYSMTTCDAGYSCNSCKRSACGSGKYQDKTGQSSCKSCSTQTSNKYPNSAGGSDSISDCYLTLSDGQYVPTVSGGAQSCPAGSYCKKSGTTVYHSTPNTPTTVTTSGQCAAGTYQDTTGQASCKPCNNGKYQNETGKTSCKTCDDGNYTSNDGKSYTACNSCGSDQISNNDHNGCITCSKSAGQISHNNQCKVCPAGTKVNTAGDGCDECPSGTYNENAKDSCDSCGKIFITDTTKNPDSNTSTIAPYIGATKKEQCYLNPNLKLIDTINTTGVLLNTINKDKTKIFFSGGGS